ncbi:TBC1 domain family member 5-like isoform X2 [Lingula anatina]|uniref:TBC1 domain family member 5 n=1 Tax=Lingula anatina TaxID=7574 RepID=A0A1S3IAS2_LINAN|nr:TBC1 domain family member 5-like isoform X2 [Lingula anatina]|eukprot:XP_013395365.1 TBC1 domain family member 5-like isoform X2 [Lingula anatina]
MASSNYRIRQKEKTKAGSEVFPTKEDIMSTLEQFGEKNNSECAPPTDSTPSTPGRLDYSSYEQIDTPNTGSSITNSYCSEWERLFERPDYMKIVRRLGVEGHLRSTRFRSVIWKLYLEVLPEDQDQWIEKTRQKRQEYEDLKDKLITNPRQGQAEDLSVNNPLSQAEESPWNQFFLDNELRLTIKQDVIRTYPRIEFFHSNKVRNMMVDGLFIYAKIKPDVSYRQGMHELLAPLIFVLHCDHQAFLHATEMESVDQFPDDQRDIVKELLDPRYIEHDAYTMFCQIMETVEPWYISKEIYPNKKQGIIHAQPFVKLQDLPSNVIVNKLIRIQDYILKKYDIELHMHLERLEIAPQIYGIRWVRLLFGREFPMQDLLVLWDAIFADGISFDLVDYVFVSMLLYIRDLLLTGDYVTCLTSLMKYPPVGDINYMIEKALYLREPNDRPKPPNYTYQIPNAAKKRRDQNKITASNLAEKIKSSFNASSFATLTRRGGSNRPQTISTNQKISKSSSEPMNLVTDKSPDKEKAPSVPGSKKTGSTASLSKIEQMTSGLDSTSVDNTPSESSSNSMARLETTSSTGQQSSGAVSGGRVEQFEAVNSKGQPIRPPGTPPTRHKGKKFAPSVMESELSHKLAYAQGQVNDMEAMARYCASKMDIHIEKLQSELLHQNVENEDEILLSLAGLKQVRDILKGTLKFQRGLESEEFSIRENHYQEVHQQAESSLDRKKSDDQFSTSSSNQNGTFNMPAVQQLYAGSSEDGFSDSPSPVLENKTFLSDNPTNTHGRYVIEPSPNFRADIVMAGSPQTKKRYSHDFSRRRHGSGRRSHSDSEDAAGLLESSMEVHNPTGKLSFDWS